MLTYHLYSLEVNTRKFGMGVFFSFLARILEDLATSYLDGDLTECVAHH